MMIDKNNQFANGVSVALAAGTTLLGDVIDTASDTGNAAGWADSLYLVITVTTAIVTGGSAGTIQFKLTSDTAANGTTSPNDILLTPAYVTDDDPTIPAGTVLFCGELPANYNSVSKSVAGVPVTTNSPGGPYQRYLNLFVTVGTTTITGGAVSAFLTHDPYAHKNFAAGI